MSLMLGNPQAKISGIDFKHGPKGRQGPRPSEARARWTERSCGVLYSAGAARSSGSSLLTITHQIDLYFPAAPGLDFSWASWDPIGVLVTVGPYLMVMLHIIVILAFVGIGALCHMIGDRNTIYRE
jgi:hypothetical protein